MKQLIRILTVSTVLLIPLLTSAQTTRTVLLEQFTGTWCGYCPYGADTVKAILATMPNVKALAYHQGASDPMVTTEGNTLIAAMSPSYPNAAIDRVLWSGQSKIPISRGLWRAKCVERSPVSSPFSITLSGTYDPPTKLMTFNVRLEALANVTGEYRLNLIISENDINAQQTFYPPTGGTTYLNPYYHKNVVRKMVTGAAGIVLTTTGLSSGWIKDTTITYTFSTAWDYNKSFVTVFVSKQQSGAYKEVQQTFQDALATLLINTPVRLVTFHASQTPKGVLLNWRTVEESNNLGWIIERRVDEGAWNKIGFAPGNGTTRESHSYEFLDPDVTIGNTYDYRLRQRDYDGAEELSPIARVTMFSAPVSTELYQNYPNPFNPTTEIAFNLAEEAQVRLDIYDAMGRKITTLAADQLEAGTHVYNWDGLDEMNNPVTSGIYFYRLSTPTFVQTKQMHLVK